jgi:hypothetical protein
MLQDYKHLLQTQQKSDLLPPHWAAAVTPLAILYSVVTLPLAVVFLYEMVGACEWIGIALTLGSVVALGWEADK